MADIASDGVTFPDAATVTARADASANQIQLNQNVQSINQKLDDAKTAQILISNNLTPEEQADKDRYLKAKADEAEATMRTEQTAHGYVPPPSDGVSEKDKENSNRLEKFQSQQSVQASPTAAESDRQFAIAVKRSQSKAEYLFPQVADPSSPIQAKAKNIWKFLQDKNSPIVNDPDAPFIVYSIAAAELNIKPAQ